MSTTRLAIQSNPLSISNVVGLSRHNLALFFALNVALALLMEKSGAVATIHAILTLVIGIWCAARGDGLERVAVIGAYIIGTEIIWRMSNAQVPWEFGKYATTLVFVVAMLRNGRLKGPILPSVYFALLLPSVLLTVMALELDEAR